MNRTNFSTALNLISLVISILALTITLALRFPRENLGFDYLGLIIGILALLTTILIGSQIIDKIFLEKKMKKMALSTFKEKEKEIIAETYYVMLNIHLTSLICYLKSADWYKVIIIQDSMILPIKTLKEKKHAEKLASYTEELFKSWKEFSNDEKQLFIDYLKNFKSILSLSPKIVDIYVDICSELKTIGVNIES